jgi:hypothetical protein
MHPHIPLTKPELKLRLSEKGLSASIEHEGLHYSFPLPLGHAERALEDACLHIRSGMHPQKITTHFLEHKFADSHCPCCKLEGRILSAQGRKHSTETDRLIASRAHTGGRVEVRHIRPGISGAQLKAYEAAYAKRTTPHSNVVKSVNKRIDDLI